MKRDLIVIHGKKPNWVVQFFVWIITKYAEWREKRKYKAVDLQQFTMTEYKDYPICNPNNAVNKRFACVTLLENGYGKRKLRIQNTGVNLKRFKLYAAYVSWARNEIPFIPQSKDFPQ